MAVSKKSLALSLLSVSLILAGCGNPEEKEAKYLKRGNEFFDRGDYEKARVEYKNAARLKPTAAEPRYRLGLVEEAEDNLRPAFADFVHAEEQDPHFHPVLLKLADYYLAGNRVDQAQKRIDIVLSDTPDDPEGHALRAALFLRQKDYANSEKEARFALSKDPTNSAAYSVLVGLYAAQDDMQKAQATIDDGVAHDPKDLSLLITKARVYDRAHNMAKVEEVYKTIFELKPKERRYRLDLAALYLKAGQPDNAEAALRAGIAAMPDDEDLEHTLVAFLGDQRGVDAAEHEVQSYMSADPKHDDASLWLVDIYGRHNDIEHASRLLDQIIAKHGNDAEGMAARTVLAHINYAKGDKQTAESMIATVLEKDPNNLEALYIRGHIAFDKGDYQNAISDMRTIIRTKPKNKEALELLSETLALQGHLDLAIDTMNQLVDADPHDYAARVRLAQLQQMNGDNKHAMDLLFLVTKEEPTYALGWETTARLSISAKDWATAQTAIESLTALEGQKMNGTFLHGQMLAAQGKNAEAIAEFMHVIDAEPTSPLGERAVASLVEAYRDTSRMEEATRYVEAMKSRTPVINAILGECYLSIGKIDLATTAFDAALAGNPPQQEPYLERAKLYLREKKTDQAIETLKKAALVAPADMRAPLVEAEVLGSSGKYAEATAIYEDMLRRNPALDVVANNLAEIIADYEYSDPAALEKARQAAERFTATSNPLLQDTLGWVYFRLGDLQQAQTVMGRVMNAGAKLPPQVHYHYGALLLKVGEAQKAKLELQQAVVDGANYPGLDDARKLLAGL